MARNSGKVEARRFCIACYAGAAPHPYPCNSTLAESAMNAVAVADGKPTHLWAIEPVGELGLPSAVPSNPNSRLGRKRSPIRQGWEKMDAIVVGIDVSKARLDVHVVPSGEAFFETNDAAGLEKLAGRLAELSPALVVLEATGGFERLAAATLVAAGLPVVVVNPAQVRSFADALGKRAKTDPIDAEVIARFAVAAGVKPRPLPDEQSRLLADLVARRRQISTMIMAEEARLRRAINRHLKKSIGRLLTALRREFPTEDATIREFYRRLSQLRVEIDRRWPNARTFHRPGFDD